MSDFSINKLVNRLNWLALAATAVFLLSACALDIPAQKHLIMGSDSGFPNYKLTLQTETERAAFHVKLFTLKYDECASGNIDYVEFDGAINKDAIEAFQTILREAQGCKTKKGRALYPFVYLNSSLGDYRDGYALGELFRQYNVETIVTQGQVCKAACAMAFLGGTLRKIEDTGRIIFSHAKDKGKGVGIECESAFEQVTMRAYLQKVMNVSAADHLYFNLLNYCTQPEGWLMTAKISPTWSVTNE